MGTRVKTRASGAGALRGPIPFVAGVSSGLTGYSGLLGPTVLSGTFL